MAKVVVAQVGEIPDGGVKRVIVDKRPIAVFNQEGELFALLDRCPHEGASLCKGARIGLTRAPSPGAYEHSRHGELIRCPWHGWEFDLRTGQSYCDPARTRVPTYEVSIAHGASLAEGPYVAETFVVSVEDEYVMVDV